MVTNLTEPQKAERDAFEKRMLSDDFDWQQHHLIRGEDGEYTYLDLRDHWREFHAGFEAGRSAGEQELQRLYEALEDIADPMAKIQTEAKAKGLRINGMIANGLCQDPNWLREKARAALKEAPDAR